MIQLLLFAITGLAVVCAAIWWFSAARDAFMIGHRPPVLGAFEVHNPPAGIVPDTLKKELPRLVLSELNTQQARANGAMAALEHAQKIVNQNTQTPGALGYGNIAAPRTLAAPIDIELKVAEIDAGTLIGLLSRRATEQNHLKINIVFNSDGQNARIYGLVENRPEYSFAVEAQADLDKIISAIAGSIIYIETTQKEKRLSDIGVGPLQNMISSLSEYANIEKMKINSSEDLRSRYKGIYDNVQDIANRFDRWAEIQWLAASAAERAEMFDKAILHFRNLREYYADLPAEQVTEIAKLESIREIEKKIALFEQKVDSPQRRALDIAADANADKVLLEELVSRLESFPSKDQLTRIRERLQLPDSAPRGKISVGIVGVPSEQVTSALGGTHRAPIPENEEYPDFNRSIDEYISSIAVAVQLAAPDALFSFSGPTRHAAVSEHKIILGLTNLAGTKVKVLLNTFGRPLTPSDDGSVLDTGLEYQRMANFVENESVFVLAAGNESWMKGDYRATSFYHSIADRALVVQALDEDNKSSDFSSIAEGGIWVLGENIPAISIREDGTRATMSGTSHAAALTAGLAAVLIEEFPAATAPQVVTAIKQASGGPPENPVPLTYPAARDALSKILADNT